MVSERNDTENGRTIDDYWAMFHRRRWIVYLITIMAGFFAAWISQTLTPRYEARTQFYVPLDAILKTHGPEEGNLRAPIDRDTARSYLSLFKSRDITAGVADQFEDRTRYGIERSTDIEVSPRGSIILYARDRDPEVAAQIASAFLQQFREFHMRAMRQDLERSIRDADRRIMDVIERNELYGQGIGEGEELPDVPGESSLPIAVEDLVKIRQEMARELVRLSDPIVVIEQPTAPEVPVFPIVPLNVFIAVIGGFLVGLIYAAMLDHMDEKRKRGRIEASERNKMIDRVLQEWMERKNTN